MRFSFNIDGVALLVCDAYIVPRLMHVMFCFSIWCIGRYQLSWRTKSFAVDTICLVKTSLLAKSKSHHLPGLY